MSGYLFDDNETMTEETAGEVWNKDDGFSTYYYNHKYSGITGDTYFDQALLAGWKIGASGSLDNHQGPEWSTSNPDYRMAVLATAKTRDAVMEAFRARRFYSTLEKNARMWFEIDGASMGSTISPGTRTLRVKAYDNTKKDFYKVQIIKNGSLLRTDYLNYAEVVDYSHTLTVSSGDYYYVRLYIYYGKEMISSPIWVE